MKTASQYCEEAIENYALTNDSNPGDYVPPESFFESAMKSYAKDVATKALEVAALNATEYFDWQQMDETKDEYVNMVKKTPILTP